MLNLNAEKRFRLPPDLACLPVITALPWLQIDQDPGLILEGPAFDRSGNLFITSPGSGRVFKITPRKRVQTIFNDQLVKVDGAAFHRDGRLFVVCLSGELLIIDPLTFTADRLYPTYRGEKLSMNDLVFDKNGNLYVSDFKGTVMDPTGGVFRISADAQIVQPVALHMASPNGVSLSPRGNALWVSESCRNSVMRIGLMEDGVSCVPVAGVLPVYYSSGFPGPDSNKVDAEGNLYQCIMGQGRIVVLDSRGIPAASVVVSGCADGEALMTSNLAFKPGTHEGYITTAGQGGAWIYRFKGLAAGWPLYSHSDE